MQDNQSGDSLVPSLAQFQGEHARMEALFEGYQFGLMSLDLAEARMGLEGLQYELKVHMAVEDTVLMPLFEQLEEKIEGAAPEFFKAEHAKLHRLLGGFFDQLARLEHLEKLTRRDTLLLIEKGFTFKHLFEHHTSREDKAFYPAISASLTLEEREQAWKRMDEVEAATRAALGSPPGMDEVDNFK